jgi:dienelactone hydrolase
VARPTAHDARKDNDMTWLSPPRHLGIGALALRRARPSPPALPLLLACSVGLGCSGADDLAASAAGPAQVVATYGDVIVTSADAPRELPLPAADVERLEQLAGARIPELASDPSPDGRLAVVELRHPTTLQIEGRALMDLGTRALRPLPDAVGAADPLALGDRTFAWASRDELLYLEAAPPADGLARRAAPRGRQPGRGDRWIRHGAARPTAIATRRANQPPVTHVRLVTVQLRDLRVTSRALEVPGAVLSTSPRLDRLLVQGAAGGQELGVYDVRTGQVAPLGDLPDDLRPTAAAWSPQLGRLAVVAGRPSDPDLGPFVADTGPSLALSSLGEPSVQDALGRLPPAENPILASQVIVYDLASGAAIQTVTPSTASPRRIARVAWAPSGASLMVLEVVATPIAGRPHPLAELALRVERAMIAIPSGAVRFRFGDPGPSRAASTTELILDDYTVLLTTFRGLDYDVVRFDGRARRYETLAALTGSLSDVDEIAPLVLDASRARVLATIGAYATPPELHEIALAGGRVRPLTELNRGLARAARVRAHRVSLTLRSGARRTGYWVAPASAVFPPAAPQPVVVWQLGGPAGYMSSEWAVSDDNPATALAATGIPTLVVPLVGRRNDGRAAEAALFEGDSFGSRDIDEAAEILQQLIHRGWVDGKRIGVTGCSYGGYFAAQSVARHPDLYAAANPQCGVYDLGWTWQFDDKGLTGLIMGKTPGEAPAEYLADSPLYHTAKMRAPLLLSHGDLDSLPVHAAQQLHDELTARGVPVTLLRFTDEPHGLFDAGNNLFSLAHQIRFFREHLHVAP